MSVSHYGNGIARDGGVNVLMVPEEGKLILTDFDCATAELEETHLISQRIREMTIPYSHACLG